MQLSLRPRRLARRRRALAFTLTLLAVVGVVTIGSGNASASAAFGRFHVSGCGMPSTPVDTWTRWGADGDGDGTADPHQLDDAALAAARYLCASSTMTDAAGWRRAVFAYNHLDAYVDDVAALANRYAAATG